MMSWADIIIIFLLVTTILLSLGKSKSKKSSNQVYLEKKEPVTFKEDSYQADYSKPVLLRTRIPENLGVKPGLGLEELVQRLENALNPEYMAHLKERVLLKGVIDREEYDWYLFEFKRFLIMASLFKGVPMYSDHVDVIWHEALMFTKSYDDFCEKFTNKKIHHQPNVGKSIISPENQRAWFDLVYTTLFKVKRNSEEIYEGFFRFPLGEETLNDVLHASDEELRDKYFNANTYEAHQVVDKLLDKIKEKRRQISYDSEKNRVQRYREIAINNDRKYRSSQNKSKDKNQTNDDTATNFLLFSMLTYNNNDNSDTKDNDNFKNEDSNSSHKQVDDLGWSSGNHSKYESPTSYRHDTGWSNNHHQNTHTDNHSHTKAGCDTSPTPSHTSSDGGSSGGGGGGGSSCSSCGAGCGT